MINTSQDSLLRRRGFLIGAVAVGVLSLAAIAIVVTSNLQPASSGASPIAPGVQPSAVADASTSACGLDDGNADELMAAPPTDWSIVGTIAAPSSPSAGPGVINGEGLRTCYAHSPSGALFATANIWAMGSDDRLGHLITEQMTVSGPGRDAALAADSSSSDSGVGVQIAGFKVLSYSDSDATIDLAFQLSTGDLMSFAMALKWVDEDWKASLTDDGLPPFRPVALQSFGGYIPWSGL